ncbi:helix-turn-helix transcriptional regulator [Nocardiopsis sp. NPDC049922]|uniref:helix-turn-helix domain-containing protein n=1 Tax=Nocardiopsis sp. NPDC049922 TaxID=3155157 RepID=UPI0033E5F885
MPASPHIGPQLARRRRLRALTQEELAAAAGVSVDVVRRLEQGKRTGARLATLDALADALGCATAGLLTADPEPVETAPGLDVDGIRHALTGPDALDLIDTIDAAEPDPPSVVEMRAEMGRVWALYQDGAYAQVSMRLPEVIAQARYAAREWQEQDQVAAHGILATAYQASAGVAITLGHKDLAFLAVDRALAAARASGSQLHHAAAANFLSWIYRRQGRLSQAEQIATRAAEACEPSWMSATPEQVAVFGALVVNAAGAAARAGHAPRCWDLTSIARSAAERVGGDRTDRWAVFGPGVVAMTAVNDAVELGELDLAHHLIDRVPSSGRAPASWRARYLLNAAHTRTELRHDQQAATALLGAHRIAPEWVRYHPQAHTTTQALLERGNGRRVPNLVDLAQDLGL